MAKTKTYVSFDYDHDETLKEFLSSVNQNMKILHSRFRIGLSRSTLIRNGKTRRGRGLNLSMSWR